VDRPFETIAPRFLRDPGWLETLLSSASGATAARCRRGTVRRRADTLVVPMHWSLDDEATLPPLDGDLAIVPIDPGRCRISLEATYALDGESRETPHITEHAVEAAVRAFLSHLVAALETTGDGDGDGGRRPPEKEVRR
jgi:hypothetical protein